MNKVMKFKSKNVYGKTQLYPACKLAEDFLKAQGLKVFTDQAIAICKLLDVKLEQVHDEVKI